MSAQTGRLSIDAPAYLWPNLVGSGVLAYAAWHESQWGFLLLEGVWAGVTLMTLLSRPPSERSG